MCKGAIRVMTPLEMHLQNDLNGLRWLHKFGSLRAVEIGQLLWPGNASARHQADRLIRSWLTRRLVIARALPLRAGRAFVLATAGARMLTEHGIDAVGGKDWGETQGGVWTPPTTWKHDLLSTCVLVDLYRRGFDVWPELHIKRQAGKCAKLPDGLAIRGDQVVWIETEVARKTGPSLKALATAVCAVAEGTAAPICGSRPTHVMVVFNHEQRDERGHAINHRQRVSRAVAAVARHAVPITWAGGTMRSAGLESVTYTSDLIEADRAAAILKRLDAAGWQHENGLLVSRYGKRRAVVCEDDEASCWAWQVDDIPAGRVATISEAKRRCAEQLAVLPPQN